VLLISKKKPSVPETLLKKKNQRKELLQKREKNAVLLKKVHCLYYNNTCLALLLYPEPMPKLRFLLKVSVAET